MKQSAERKLKHLIADVKDRSTITTAAMAVDRAVELGFLSIGGAVHQEERKPKVVWSSSIDGLNLTGWRPRLMTEHGGTYPPVVRASRVGRTAIWYAAGGDVNTMYERSMTPGAAILPENKWYQLGAYGHHYNSKTGLYDLNGHSDLVAAIRVLPPASIIGEIDFVKDDGSFSIAINTEPGHVASRQEQTTVTSIPVYAGEVQALLPEVNTAPFNYEPIPRS